MTNLIMVKTSYEKVFAKRLKESDTKVKTSFVLIRQDIDEMQITVDAMRDYLKKKDKQYTYAKKEDNKIRDEFRKDVDEFTQEISQLKLALSAVRELRKELVIRKELAQIEDRIKISFKNDIEEYKNRIEQFKINQKELEKRITAIENDQIKEGKKSWFRRAGK